LNAYSPVELIHGWITDGNPTYCLLILAIHPNLAVSAVIAELPIFCPNRASGCTEQLPLEHINQHLGHCPFQHSFCPHRAFGCSFEGLSVFFQQNLMYKLVGSANEMSQHASTCIFAKLSHYLNQQNERILSLEEQLSVRSY
jgi:hypothetical protein